MSDELTRAIAEALGCEERIGFKGNPYCATHNLGWSDTGWPCDEADIVAAALTPLIVQREQRAFDRGYDKAMEGIEARVREARAEALAQVSEVLDASTAKFDRAVGGPTEPTRFVRDIARNLRNDAEEVRRG